jgi:hypothetical protein
MKNSGLWKGSSKSPKHLGLRYFNGLDPTKTMNQVRKFLGEINKVGISVIPTGEIESFFITPGSKKACELFPEITSDNFNWQGAGCFLQAAIKKDLDMFLDNFLQ